MHTMDLGFPQHEDFGSVPKSTQIELMFYLRILYRFFHPWKLKIEELEEFEGSSL